MGRKEEEESHSSMPRKWRQSEIKQAMNRTLVSLINREGEFSFHTYIYTPSSVVLLTLYEEHNRYIFLSRRETLEPLAIVMAAIVAPGMLPYKL